MVWQSVTYRYREFFIVLVVSEKMVPEKVSEPVSDKFGTGTYFRCQNLGILKIYNGYQYQEFFIFLEVSELVSEKFGTEKSTRIGVENIWYQKKVSVSVSFNILGTVTN